MQVRPRTITPAHNSSVVGDQAGAALTRAALSPSPISGDYLMV